MIWICFFFVKHTEMTCDFFFFFFIDLFVVGEKRCALLAEVARLREERSSESEEPTEEDTECISQQPCRGTVSITNIQLPLKVEFVCSSQNRTGTLTVLWFKNQEFIIVIKNKSPHWSAHLNWFTCPLRSANPLLLCSDSLRSLQHHRHAASHCSWCSKWRHDLLPNNCHNVSYISSVLLSVCPLGFFCLFFCLFLNKFHVETKIKFILAC